MAFDLGGVVCRFDPHVRWVRIGETAGLDPDVIDARLHESGYMDACDTGALSADESRGELERLLDHQFAPDELETLWCSAFTPDADVVALLDRIHPAVRLGMLSNNGYLLRHALPRAFPDLADHFDPIVFSCETGHCKPAPRAYRVLAERMQVDPDAVAFVDDTRANVDGAEACGMCGVHFRDATALERDLHELGLLA